MRSAVAFFSAVFIACITLPYAANAQGSSYDFWREENARRSPQSAVPNTPLFSIIPSFPSQPSLKEILDPFADKLDNCLLDHARRAIADQVNPADFNRIINGACDAEASALSQALLHWWTAVSPRTAYEAGDTSDRFVRKHRNEVISLYTQQWYADTAKQDAPKSSPTISTGSGFFISHEGHILTNNHVVSDCAQANIKRPDGTNAAAAVLIRNEADDLAILKSAVAVKTPATLRATPEPRIGEQIVVFGFPLAGILTSTGNATIGNIAGSAGIGNDPNHLQISAPVQLGNSGGPLLDMRGNVIGVVDMKINALSAAAITGDIPQNINFAIKGSVVKQFLDEQGISYLIGEPEKELSIPDVVDHAKEFSVAIECKMPATEQKHVSDSNTLGPDVCSGPILTQAKECNAGGQFEPKPEGPAANGGALHTTSQLRTQTVEFLNRIYSAISGPDSDAIKFFNDTYADNLVYFGKPVTREQAILQVASSFKRWPQRQYKLKQDSVDIQCDVKDLICTAKGTLEFDTKSPERNERSTGLATFEYTINYTSPTATPRITAEGGKTVERSKQPLSSDAASPWDTFLRKMKLL